MKMIVGLGNPGSNYSQTRHNVGFMAVDLLAKKLGTEVSKNKYKALIAETKIDKQRVLLVKPQTYMNLSGEAVGSLARWYKIAAQDVVVIYDDMDLTLGRLRIRPQGGPGGHNGMKSIIAHLGTNNFPRIRIGIGRPAVDAVNYVLGKFSTEEWDQMEKTLALAAEAAEALVMHGINTAMNKYNG
ncbi:aminoacyl-tRNA hydrolase [Desulfofalx alkaliphila]|uniref:aminoacyl-tRNA hydrolase n=1 Tax=Desulfofalx alkaliphila TaxID=105483 RepID=UPI0004E1021D|nr:aminoacyl-tRNA hydrolase [Desulfofalx alkaliphila]